MNAMHAAQRSAWREPMVWLVAAIPASAVIASCALLTAAARSSGSDDAVGDTVRRTAQVQVADLGPDARARQLGLQAIARIDGETLAVLPAVGGFDRNRVLLLTLRHPTHAERDRNLRLQPTRDGWATGATSRIDPLDMRHDWNVQLTPADGRWRLQGRWGAGTRAVHLGPALPQD